MRFQYKFISKLLKLQKGSNNRLMILVIGIRSGHGLIFLERQLLCHRIACLVFQNHQLSLTFNDTLRLETSLRYGYIGLCINHYFVKCI